MKREFINGDCMEVMKDYPDDYFNLAIVDPPYGSDWDAIGKVDTAKNLAPRTKYKSFQNIAPSTEYFQEVKRVSTRQIVFGVNHFKGVDLGSGRLVWDKKGTAFGRAEMAAISFTKSVNIVEIEWNGMIQHNMKKKEKRIHPTQKPVALYRWILKNYAKPGDILLDTHVGSASSLIAFEEYGFEYVATELDKDYYQDATKRLKAWRSQQTLFNPPELFRQSQVEQTELF